jgi:energy-coupling factor transporter ATP-binding protein EcfA2
MEILLPNKKGSNDSFKVDSKSIVLVGANGSGKSRLGTYLEMMNIKRVHRIAAQKSLSMPAYVSPKTMEVAESEFIYGGYHQDTNWQELHGKRVYRWGDKPNTFLLNDYEKLMVLLFTDETDASIKFKDAYNPGQDIPKPVTKLDRIKAIWECLLPHRRLLKGSGKIDTFPTHDATNIYNSSEMSDGERVIFYLIGEAICAKENSIIIADEPEMHIHKSITKNLWDKIEQERPDCTFVYLTHDIDFASSRQNSQKIWIKSFEGNDVWDYEILPNEAPLPEPLYLEILGSRKPILFIEGDDRSIDYQLYLQIFPEFTVKPLGNCQKVFDSTKAFNDNKAFHNLVANGLIDRDRRDIADIAKVVQSQVWVPKVAEVENFFLLEELIGVIASLMKQNKDDVVAKVKTNVINRFKDNMESQALEHTIFRVKRIFSKELNPISKTFSDLKSELNNFWNQQDFDKIYDEYMTKFNELIKQNDYKGILEVFNHKGILSLSNVLKLCCIADKTAYRNLVIAILKENKSDGEIIKNAILSMIEK